MMKGLLLLCAAILIAGGGCSSKKEAAQISADEPQTEVRTQTPQERTITLAPKRDQAPPAAETARVISESRPVMQRDQILSLRGGGIYGPEDFEIGELQGYSSDKNVRAILERIRSFQAVLKDATVPLADIHPDWETQAQRSLGFHLDRGNVPVDVRVGAIEIYAPGMARANIRMMGDPGIAFGEIYLKKMDDVWLVDDMQIDMQNLSEVPAEREEPYEPSVYRMTDMP